MPYNHELHKNLSQGFEPWTSDCRDQETPGWVFWKGRTWITRNCRPYSIFWQITYSWHHIRFNSTPYQEIKNSGCLGYKTCLLIYIIREWSRTKEEEKRSYYTTVFILPWLSTYINKEKKLYYIYHKHDFFFLIKTPNQIRNAVNVMQDDVDFPIRRTKLDNISTVRLDGILNSLSISRYWLVFKKYLAWYISSRILN